MVWGQEQQLYSDVLGKAIEERQILELAAYGKTLKYQEGELGIRDELKASIGNVSSEGDFDSKEEITRNG